MLLVTVEFAGEAPTDRVSQWLLGCGEVAEVGSCEVALFHLGEEVGEAASVPSGSPRRARFAGGCRLGG